MNIEQIIDTLKQIIDREGHAYLKAEPYSVYCELRDAEGFCHRDAGLILLTLLADVPGSAKAGLAKSEISRLIRRECRFTKSTADQLADMYADLFSEENQKQWDSMDRSGLKDFLNSEWEVKWDGEATWDYGSGFVDCFYSAKAALEVDPEVFQDKILSKMLDENPFLTRDAIIEHYRQDMTEYLDTNFEYYCTCDDYYQPVVEDFEIDYYLKEWARQYGFQVIWCEGDGSDGGYEPKQYR